MKKLLAAVALLLCAAPLFAQVPYLSPSQISPHWGFIRKAPCGLGQGDNCGSNPPTWHLTPDQCGTLISTGAAKNADGSNSSQGVRHTLPTNAEFATWGYTAAGPEGSSGSANREGQCEIHFVMGAPGPSNYLRLGIDGVAGVDKVTFFGTGAYDMNYGDLVFPYLTPGVLTVIWNGTSWLMRSATPAIAERMGMGQLFAHGQGRLVKVKLDPPWWTVGSRIGGLAYCPVNGRGTVAQSNGGYQLSLMPINCVFLENDTSAGTDWIGLRNFGSTNVTGLFQGAAYASGTAPNGVAYAAGNYVVATLSTATALVTGNTVEFHNLRTNLGTYVDGRFIVKKLTVGDPGCASGLCYELHEKIDEGNGTDATSAVGPPSSFVAGDALTATATGASWQGLVATGIGSARFTNPINGMDVVASTRNTVLGVVRRTVANGYEDSDTSRGVASMFNPVIQKCRSVPTSDFTTTSTTFVTVTGAACTFAYLNGVNTGSTMVGDPGRRVTYTATIGAANGTAANGCEFNITLETPSAWSSGTTYAFAARVSSGGLFYQSIQAGNLNHAVGDTAWWTPVSIAEPEIAGFVNPTGVSGGRQTVTVAGGISGILADGSHTITLQARAVTGGTCTVYAASTNLVTLIPQ